MFRRLTAAAAIAAGGLAGLGCGDGDSSTGKSRSAPAPKAPATTPARAQPKTPGVKLKVVQSQFGPVVADRHGEALYLFDKEKSGRGECYGECAATWPPMLTKGKPRARGAAQSGLVGTTRRRDGKLQATYRGHPLYYYRDDSPGQILCQSVIEFGGLWLVVRPDGNPVT